MVPIWQLGYSDAVYQPICEVLLDQDYFNGVGNYLLAEALHRCGIWAFDSASDVLALMLFSQGDSVEKSDRDLLCMLHKLALELVEMLGSGNNYNFGQSSKKIEFTVPFLQWWQCYRQRGAKSVRNKKKRNVWYRGELGSSAMVEKRKGWTISVELDESNTEYRKASSETKSMVVWRYGAHLTIRVFICSIPADRRGFVEPGLL